MDESAFAKEDKKYSELWASDYGPAGWKRLAKAAANQARSLSEPKIVDLGFGEGSAMEYFKSLGLHVEGVDISKYAVDKYAESDIPVYHSSLDSLDMFDENQFNIAFSNDVIEHVP